MDSYQINEAKVTSLNQEKKIKELEAQLQEAGDIENKLKEELRFVQGKCERVSMNDVQYLNTHENATLKEIFEDNRQSQSIPSHLRDSEKDFLVAYHDKENLGQRTEYPRCCCDAIQKWNLYGTMSHQVPSILRRSKKPKVAMVCKDGCISHRYGVHPIDSIRKIIEEATRTKEMKETTASRKEIPNSLFRKLNQTPGVPYSDPTLKSVESRARPNEGSTCVVPKLLSDVTGMVTERATITKTSANDNEGDIEELSSKTEPLVDLLVVPIVQEGASTVCSDKVVNESTALPERKTINETSKGSSLQLFKYTFQRKQKRA